GGLGAPVRRHRPAGHLAPRRGGHASRAPQVLPATGRRGRARALRIRRHGASARLMDLLALAEVRWGYFRTRKQFLLSRFPDRWRVFYAQPPGSSGDDPWTPRREGN